MATIKEIAELAGVSRRTVDRVINHRGTVKPETEELINSIIKQVNYTPNTAGRSLAAHKKKLRLLFCSTKGTYSPIYEPIREGARAKSDALTEYGVTTTFLTIDRDQLPSQEEIDEIISHIDYDGIAISPVKIKGIVEIIEAAQRKGIPLVFYNVDHSDYSRLCFIGCNYFSAGRLAAGLCSFASNDSGNVYILSSIVANRPSYEDRVAGFKQELAQKYPNMKLLGESILKGDQFDHYDQIKEILLKNPDINIIYLVNPGDYSACYSISKAVGKKSIRIITNDLMEKQIPMLKDGLISATIDQEPQQQGALSLEVLFNSLALGIQPESDIINTKLSILIGQSIS